MQGQCNDDAGDKLTKLWFLDTVDALDSVLETVSNRDIVGELLFACG